MTALAAPIFAQTIWPDWRRLVSIDAAAERLDLSERHLSRLCAAQLERDRMAYFGRHPNGGQEKWFVFSDYDTRLAAGPIGDDWIEPDLSSYTDRQRETGLQRRACVEAFDQARYQGKVSRDQVQRLIEALKSKFDGLKISRSRLYAWATLYRRPVDTVKLIDNRGGNRRHLAEPAAWKMFGDLYCHENQPSIRRCWQEVDAEARKNGWQWCDLDACRRQLDERIPIQQQIKARQPERYRTKMAPFIAQHPEAWAANECYVGDHKQLDLICKWRDALIRPWLSCWMDWRTRKVVGYVLSDEPNSTTILAALRHALKDETNFGGPRCVWIDNGKDYSAWMFHGSTKAQRQAKIQPNVDEPRAHGIFNALQIEAHFATAYNPNGKARLETWFRNLTPFCQTFDSYTGMSIETKPERLNEIVKNPRLVPTFETVHIRVAEFIAGNNLRTDHAIDDLSEDRQTISPNEAMGRWCDTRRMRNQDALDLLLMNWHKPVTVGRNGIAIGLAGQVLHYGQFESALAPFKALSKADRKPILIAFDPHDLRSVRVHDEQWRYICTATMNQLGGRHGTDAISVEHVKAVNRNKAQYTKSSKQVADHSFTSILTTEEQLAQAAADAAKPTPPSSSPMMMISGPLDGEVKHIEQDQLKTAVGAESSAPRRALRRLPRDIQRGADIGATLRPNPFAKIKEQLHEW